ncbi:MAG TPA: RsmE family RNA methyltransferase [Candidatus Kapabacteria bacterium]|nr:RsmE family RNA methyltransferase [Candidatus Kapabacteria bacterium]
MECFIVEPTDVFGDQLILQADEAHHAARSLRMKVGETILATDLQGNCYRATIESITEISKGEYSVECKIDQQLPDFHEPPIKLRLIQGILNQPSKFEEIAERCTELGIISLVPIISERVERVNLKTERLEKILCSACKQAHRARKPKLSDAVSFEESLKQAADEGNEIILLHEGASVNNSLRRALDETKGRQIALVIGPEGGFSEAEVSLARSNYQAMIASLGSRRLRAETAAIAAVAIAV